MDLKRILTGIDRKLASGTKSFVIPCGGTGAKLAAIYARISSSQQDEASISRQIEECHEKLLADGFSLFAIYVDKARSAFEGKAKKRLAFQSLQNDAADGRFNALYLRDRTRFSREHPAIALATEQQLIATGIKVKTILDAMSEASSEDEMHVQDIFKFLTYFSANKSSRDSRAKIRKAVCKAIESGGWTGGPPYGYALDWKDRERHRQPFLIIKDSEAAVIKQVFAWYLDDVAQTEICNRLNSKGIKPPRGKAWTQPRICDMLNRSIYIGKVTWKTRETPPKTIEGKAPAIIDQDTWDAAQRRRQHHTSQAGKNSVGCNRVFAGLIICAACNNFFRSYFRSVTKKNGKLHYARPAYKCGCNDKFRIMQAGSKCLNKTTIGEGFLSKQAKAIIHLSFYHPKTGAKRGYEQLREKHTDASKLIKKEIAEIQREITKNSKALERYYAAFESGEMDTFPAERIQDLKERIQALESTLKEKEREEREIPTLPEFEDYQSYWRKRIKALEETEGAELRKLLIDIGFRAIVSADGQTKIQTAIELPTTEQVRDGILSRGTGKGKARNLGSGGGSSGQGKTYSSNTLRSGRSFSSKSR